MSVYSCTECNYTTMNKAHIKKHNESIKCEGSGYTVVEAKAVCDICSKDFETVEYLKQHKKICMDKRTKIIDNFIDSTSIIEEMNSLKMLISSQANTIRNLMKANDVQIKRIDKLEADRINKKKGYDELDPEHEDTPQCMYSKMKTFIPTDYEPMLAKLDTTNYENGHVVSTFKVRIIDPKTNLTENCTAKPSGIYDINNKMYNYGKVEVLIKRVGCSNDSLYKILKTEECYCTKHFDLENCKKVD